MGLPSLSTLAPKYRINKSFSQEEVLLVNDVLDLKFFIKLQNVLKSVNLNIDDIRSQG